MARPLKFIGMALSLRLMRADDLAAVEAWLRLPHITRWWHDTTAESEVAKYRDRIAGNRPTTMLMIVDGTEPIGWCQWYRWADYTEVADAMGALDGEVGIDYAIGQAGALGRGLGTAMIAVLVDEVRRHQPAAGVLVAPEATNTASRRVLEKNGFDLVAVRPVITESIDAPMAIYRLPTIRQRLDG